MPAIQNVERLGAVYYWRRMVRFQDGKPFTVRPKPRDDLAAGGKAHGLRHDGQERVAEDDLRPSDSPKITGDARRKARWTDKTRSQFQASARLLEKSYGARPLRLLSREDVKSLNSHFVRLPISHHKSRRHDAMTLEAIYLEASGRSARMRIDSTGTLRPLVRSQRQSAVAPS